MREGPIQAADLPLRKLAAIDALARAGHADPAMLGSITIDPNLWPDSAVIDWWSILLRVPQIPDREQRLKDAEQIMRARLNQQGTAMHLSSDARNDMWWLMVSPDCNMVRLALLLLDNNLWHDDLAARDARRAGAADARSVDRNDHQRVGHAGGQEVRNRFRIDAGRGHHERVDSGGDAKAELGKRSEGWKCSRSTGHPPHQI